VKHSYELLVKDIGEQPIDGADVSFIFIKPAELARSSSNVKCITDKKGVCKIAQMVSSELYLEGFKYKSQLQYSVNKTGYYPQSAKVMDSESDNENVPPVRGSVVLYKPADYLSEIFMNSSDDTGLREQAIKFISLIRLQSMIVDADIMLGSTGTSAFKGQKYFQMKINTTNIFNSLKLDKYGIAKKLFDDSIRKILNPLNENISNPKTFYGYDLIIYGNTKSFAEESALPEKIEYRFLIPQDTVRRYKDKDISGQQVLDASVILMNDERIELKLQ
jgi:hypothetical protein